MEDWIIIVSLIIAIAFGFIPVILFSRFLAKNRKNLIDVPGIKAGSREDRPGSELLEEYDKSGVICFDRPVQEDR